MQLSKCVGRTLWCGALIAAISGCGKNQPEANDPSEASLAMASRDTSAEADRETTVQISKTLRERCQLPDTPQGAPKFDFDQATLRPRGQNVLDDVAICLTSGPLKGEVITLVGRADARGSEQYNQSLSESRAAAARNYLTQRGVPEAQLKLVARGEQGARGTDEETFALDRRVDVELGDLENSPILQGTMLQAETSEAKSPDTRKAGSYADVAEGGEVVNTGSEGSSGGSVKGSASGSVNAGAGTNK